VVERRGGEAWVKDLGSRNGTFLNDERIDGEAKLEEGDRIRVGATVIVFEVGPAPLPPGTKLGPYEVTGVAERRRGVTVQLARHASLNRSVLVDVLEPGDPAAPRFLERARIGSAFDHPSLLAIYDAGEHDGRAYRVREVLGVARDLDVRLREGALDFALAASVARHVALGLAYIHARGAVHGRLTPKAILLDERNVAKLEFVGGGDRDRLDPGRPDARLQALSASPEEARGLEATAASDVYALGCILYRMLLGIPPFDGDFPTVVRGHASETPAPIGEHAPELDAELAALLSSMLEKKASQRPDAAAVAEGLAPYAISSSDEHKVPPPIPPRAAPARTSSAHVAPKDPSDEGPDLDSGSTDSIEVGSVAPARAIRKWRDFDPVRAALLGVVFALLFFLSSEGTRLALRFLQK
jgi:serine/threonine-protein kinase